MAPPTHVRLGTLCEINPDTLTDSTDRDFRFHYVDLSCVKTGQIAFPRETISFAEASPRARRKIKTGDVLLSTVRPNLRGIAIVEKKHSSAIASTGFAVLRAKPDVCNVYLYYTLLFNPVLKQMVDSVAGSNYPAITASIVADLRVPLFSGEEQFQIAAALSKWDQGIRNLNDLIAVKVRLKQALMRQLLTGRQRIKLRRLGQSPTRRTEESFDLGLSATAIEVERGLNGKSYDEGIAKLGICPQGWETRKLQELLSIAQRPVRLEPDQTYSLVTAKRYRAGIVPREQLRGEQIKTATQFETKSGDFLISRRQIVHGACGLVPASLDGAIVSNEYSCLRMSDKLDPAFFEYLTHTKYMQRSFYQSSVGVTVEKMIFRIDKWLDYEIHLPPISEQKQIVGLLGSFDKEIVLLDRLQKALADQRDGLLHKLLTGQMRVKS